MISENEGQDLLEIVNGSEVKLGKEKPNGTLRKWYIKAGKTLFAVKTTIKKTS